MLVVCPSPHAKEWIFSPYEFTITPPTPTLPGFPFAAPSKKRECLECDMS